MTKRRITRTAWIASWMLTLIVFWTYASRDASPKQLLALTLLVYLAAWTGLHWITQQKRRLSIMRFVVFNIPFVMAVVCAELLVYFGSVDFRHVFNTPVDPWQNTKNRIDPDLIHIHRPYFHAEGKLVGGDLVPWRNAPPLTNIDYNIQYDHMGFRNPIDISQAECIVVGDSFVEAGNVSSDELNTTLMAKTLGITVVNLGQSHYGPQQERVVLERFGVGQQPKICFWIFFEGNDLKDARRYGQFVRSWPDSVADYYSKRSRSFTKNLLTWLSRHNRSEEFQINDSFSGLFTTVEGSIPVWFGYEGRALTDDDQIALDTTLLTLEKAYSTCQENGIALAVVYAPTKFRVYGELCQFDEDSPINSWQLNALPEILHQRLLAISPEIGFLDLTTDLREAARLGSMPYYADDSHWSPKGHEITAKSLTTFLRTQYPHLLSPDPSDAE